MENRRSKAFLVILTVLLCLSVCVGLTYAYFTDSAKSSGNKIQAGNLKLDLKLYDKVDDEWISIKNTEDPVFNYDKWEPGYVDAKLLKIENLGDLAMQWEAKLVSTEAVSAFADAIEVYVQKSNTEIAYPADRAAALAWTKVGTLDQFINTAEKLASGTFTAQGEAYYIGIAFYMPAEITDNTLQGQILGAFDIQINATQLPYESDAFDEKYDDITIDSNGGVTPPDTTESTEDTSSSEPEPTETEPPETEPTDASSEEPTDDIEPTDPELFTWSLNEDNNSYTVTGVTRTAPENLVIPKTYNGLPVTAIGNWAFGESAETPGYCCDIQSVVIPDSITTIGEYAFYGGYNLSNVKIGNGVITIGAEAFGGCGLTGKLIIPDSVTTIGSSAFWQCGKLTELAIGNGVNTIGAGAFFECGGLTGELIIPDSVTTIGNAAFYSCINLTSITIPNSVTTIGSRMFYFCSNLQNVSVPNSITYIGSEAFYNCDSLKYNEYDNAYYLGNDSNPYVVLIKAKDDFITSCDINENTKIIYHNAFNYCSSLTSIDIPSSVTQIGDSAFSNCWSLTGELKIPDSVTTIGELAFAGCYTDMPGGYYFGLTSVTIGNNVTTIGASAFSGCSGLTSIDIPNNEITIGDFAFAHCYRLTNVTIPNSIITIGDSAFYECYRLAEVINHSALNITAGSADNGYVAYYALEVHNGESKIVEQNDYLFYTYNGVNYLLGYIGNGTFLTLPANHNDQSYEIYQYAFYSCRKLTSITIPHSVTAIGSWAFSHCSGLTSIDIPNSVTTIGDHPFNGVNVATIYCQAESTPSGWDISWNCKAANCMGGDSHVFAEVIWGWTGAVTDPEMFTWSSNGDGTYTVTGLKDGVSPTEAVIPSTYNGIDVTAIGYCAFSSCSGLTSIDIPNSVTYIDFYAFMNCSTLSSITFGGTIEQWDTFGLVVFWENGGSEIEVKCSDGTTWMPYYDGEVA